MKHLGAIFLSVLAGVLSVLPCLPLRASILREWNFASQRLAIEATEITAVVCSSSSLDVFAPLREKESHPTLTALQPTAYQPKLNGRRALKTVSHLRNGTWSVTRSLHYAWNDWKLAAECERDGNDNVTAVRTFVWGPDLKGQQNGTVENDAEGIGGLLAVVVSSNSTSKVYLPLTDGLGNIAGLIDSSDGSLAAEYDYDPYGNIVIQSGVAANACPFRHRTRYYDRESWLYYYGHRYYDPSTTKWLSKDPKGETGGWNLTAFCGCDPINNWDALGDTNEPGDFGWEWYDSFLPSLADAFQSFIPDQTRYFDAAPSPYAPKRDISGGLAEKPRYISLPPENGDSVAMMQYYAENGEYGVASGIQKDLGDALTLDIASTWLLGLQGRAFWSSIERTITVDTERELAAQHIRQGRQLLRKSRLDLSLVDRNQIIHNFSAESFRVRTLQSEILDYRYFDGITSMPQGRWSTSQWIIEPADRISMFALPNNDATKAATVRLLPGTTVFEGIVAPQLEYGSTLLGGGFQRYNVIGPRSIIEVLP